MRIRGVGLRLRQWLKTRGKSGGERRSELVGLVSTDAQPAPGTKIEFYGGQSRHTEQFTVRQ